MFVDQEVAKAPRSRAPFWRVLERRKESLLHDPCFDRHGPSESVRWHQCSPAVDLTCPYGQLADPVVKRAYP